MCRKEAKITVVGYLLNELFRDCFNCSINAYHVILSVLKVEVNRITAGHLAAAHSPQNILAIKRQK